MPKEKILLIRFYRVGDVVLAIGAGQFLKRTFPDIDITFLVDSRAYSLLEHDTAFNEVIAWPRKKWENIPKFSALKEIVSAVARLKKKRFNKVLDFQGYFETALVCRLIGAKDRIGYDEKKHGIFYNKKSAPLPEIRHDIEIYKGLLYELGINPVSNDDLRPELAITKEEEMYIDQFFNCKNIKKGSLIIGINPFASAPYKCWDYKNFADVAKELVKRYNTSLVVFWGPGEEELAVRTAELIGINCVVLCKTSLRQLAAALKKCSLFITNDSGPMHIASSLKIPTLAVFIKEHSKEEISGPVFGKSRVYSVSENVNKSKNQENVNKVIALAAELLEK